MNRILFFAAMIFSCAVFAEVPELKLPESVKITYGKNRPSGHIQGVATDGKYIYLSYSGNILKSDWQGNIIKFIKTPRFDGLEDPKNDIAALKKKFNIRIHHSGDCCFHDGKLYVAYCGSGFNRRYESGWSYNYVYVFDTDLNFIRRHHVPDMVHGAGGITFANGRFYLVGGRPAGVTGNTLYEYDSSFKLLKKHQLKFNSDKGIQTISWDGEHFWIGCYKTGDFAFLVDKDFKVTSVAKAPIATGVLNSSDRKTLLCFRDVFRKRKILHNIARRINVSDCRGKALYLKIDEKGNFVYDGKNVTAAEFQASVRRRNYSKDFLFITYAPNAPQPAIAEAVLAAQQIRITFQLLPE